MLSLTNKAAILLCDEVPDKYLAKFGGYADMIRSMFAAIDVDIDFDSYDCRLSDFPRHLDQYDFFITTGSKYSVYDDEPWIQHTVEFIRRLDYENKKLIGICFGHQLIAKAFDIPVEKSPKGWGVGVASNRITGTTGWMDKIASELNIIVSHQDQITALTKDAKLIAASDFCPYFMVQWNRNFISIQGHPEWNRDYSRARINDRHHALSSQQTEAALASLNKEPDNRLCAKWMVNFISGRHD